MFVLDASVALAWSVADESVPGADEILGALKAHGAIVPPVWPLEVANALLVGARRQRISPAEAVRLGELLADLPIEVVADDDPMGAFRSVSSLARQQGVSAYDASYLELALRRGLPLATLDRRLGEAAARLAVPLVEQPPDA